MRLTADEAMARFGSARVAHLATADGDGQPHLVPVTFALDSGGRILVGIDHKPKASSDLRRLRNIAVNPQVSVLADHYDEDWNRLWWARADGTALISREGADHEARWGLLRDRYRQYDGLTLVGPVIAITPARWSGWSFSPAR